METFFSRHTVALDIDDPTRERLWRERRLAIHFPGPGAEDSRSLDPGDYPDLASRRAIGTLRVLAKNGGYVCTSHFPREEVLVGYIAPGSEIDIIEGKWGSRQGFAGRTAVLKSLPLQRCKLVSPLDHAVLLVGRPRQGTIMKWPSAGDTIRNLVDGLVSLPKLSNLNATQQEILCMEFLRGAEALECGLPMLRHLLLPPGRTLKDLDIVGLATDGRRIMAQVTYAAHGSKLVGEKLERLRPYAGEGNPHLVLFCQCDAPVEDKGITLFPIGWVYRSFTATPEGRQWLQLSS